MDGRGGAAVRLPLVQSQHGPAGGILGDKEDHLAVTRGSSHWASERVTRYTPASLSCRAREASSSARRAVPSSSRSSAGKKVRSSRRSPPLHPEIHGQAAEALPPGQGYVGQIHLPGVLHGHLLGTVDGKGLPKGVSPAGGLRLGNRPRLWAAARKGFGQVKHKTQHEGQDNAEEEQRHEHDHQKLERGALPPCGGSSQGVPPWGPP